METVTLRGEDFKTIHNTLCELRSLVGRMNHSMIKVDDVEKIVAQFEMGLQDAYAQDNATFDEKMDYYRQFRGQNDLSAIWSMYELPVHGFLQSHPYSSDVFVVYQGGHVSVMGSTWGDIYRAADCAMRNSGDDHHIFIEGFELKNGNELHMYTGS